MRLSQDDDKTTHLSATAVETRDSRNHHECMATTTTTTTSSSAVHVSYKRPRILLCSAYIVYLLQKLVVGAVLLPVGKNLQ